MRRCRSITDFVNAQRAARDVEGGGMSVLSIMATAHTVRWDALQERLTSHPHEAKQLDEHGRTVLFRVLSRRVDDYPPPRTVQKLVEENRAAVWEGVIELLFQDNHNNNNKDNIINVLPRQQENSPLVVAAWRKASLEILQSLTSARPSVSEDMASLVAMWNSYREVYHESEQELLDLLYEGGREAFAIFSKLHHLLAYCTTPGQILVPWGSGASLHRASAVTVCSEQLFRDILQKFPDQLQHQDKHGRLALHNVLVTTSQRERPEKTILSEEERQSKLQRLKILLEANPEASMHRDSHGQIPLHIAIESGWEFSDLQQLIDVFPQSVSERDGISMLYPFQLAASFDSSITSVFRFLKAAPDLLARKIPGAEAALPTTHASLSSMRAAAPEQKSLGVAQRESSVTDEMKALLRHLRNKNDDNLWIELQTLLQSQPAREPRAAQWLALHEAVALRECPIGFIRVLIHMHPEQLLQRDERMGRTPLHYAATNAAKSLLTTLPPSDNDDGNDKEENVNGRELRSLRLQAVLEGDRAAARIYDGARQLPLHLAASHGMPPVCLEALISAWPDSLCRRDGNQLYPFLLAACSPVCGLNEVFLLLLMAPHVLVASGVVG